MAKFIGSDSKVKELLEKDFDKSSKIKSKPGQSGIIVFFATWCGFCSMLVPEFKKLSKKSGIKTYCVDADKNPKLMQKFQVQGFPSLRFVSKDGKVSMENYYGERDAKSMLEYIKGKKMIGGSKMKKEIKKCVGKKCGGKCKDKKCKNGGKKCIGKKCGGKCTGGKCKPQKGGKKPVKKVKKSTKKPVRKVKKKIIKKKK